MEQEDELSDEEWVRLTRYLDGDLSPREAQEVDAWLREKPSRQTLLGSLHLVQRAARDSGSLDSLSPSELANWKSVKKRTLESKGSRATTRIVGTVVSAAVAGVLLFLGMRLSDDEPATPVTVWSTGPDETLEIHLDDDVRVVLAQNSILRRDHPEFRSMYLRGSARFEAEHDPARPVVVRTPHGSARAMGTTFGIAMRPKRPGMLVDVEDGQVQVRCELLLRYPATLTVSAGQSVQTRLDEYPEVIAMAVERD